MSNRYSEGGNFCEYIDTAELPTPGQQLSGMTLGTLEPGGRTVTVTVNSVVGLLDWSVELPADPTMDVVWVHVGSIGDYAVRVTAPKAFVQVARIIDRQRRRTA